MSTSLSFEISRFRSEIVAGGPRYLMLADIRAIAQRLVLLQQLARAQEQELAVHRLAEASGRRAQTIGETAMQLLGDLVDDPDGKVVRPDFGRDA